MPTSGALLAAELLDAGDMGKQRLLYSWSRRYAVHGTPGFLFSHLGKNSRNRLRWSRSGGPRNICALPVSTATPASLSGVPSLKVNGFTSGVNVDTRLYTVK